MSQVTKKLPQWSGFFWSAGFFGCQGNTRSIKPAIVLILTVTAVGGIRQFKVRSAAGKPLASRLASSLP
jgi:hypothetical protein